MRFGQGDIIHPGVCISILEITINLNINDELTPSENQGILRARPYK